MNRFEQLQYRVNERSKSILDFTADLVEWSAKKNLAVADDVAEFTVEQLRLPVKAKDFAGYRASVRDSYSDFGETLKRHGGDYVAKLRDVPEEVREMFGPEKRAAKPRKPAAKPKAAKATKARTAKAKTTRAKATKAKAAKAKTAKAKPAATSGAAGTKAAAA